MIPIGLINFQENALVSSINRKLLHVVNSVLHKNGALWVLKSMKKIESFVLWEFGMKDHAEQSLLK